MKTLHTAVAVAGIAAAAVLGWWWQNQPAGSGIRGSAMSDGAAVGASASAGARPGPPGGAPGGSRGGAGAPGGGAGSGGGPVPVEVAQAQAMTLTDEVLAVGSLRSRQGVMLRPEVSGRIARIGFADGARVQRGQLLVQLDDTLQRAQLQQAQAQASIARTNLQRSRELLGQNFVSQSAVDQNAANLDVAEAQVALARAQLARMKVLAPFDGTAGIMVVAVGDYLKDGADIVNVEDLSALTVQFALPERTIDRLRTGQPVDVTLDALPGRAFKGRVVAVDSQVDANGRALQVLAQVENPGSLLKPGMFARPRVVFSVREKAVVVPEEALVPMGTRQMLFKVTDGPDGRKVSQRVEARIGMRLAGKVEILSGVVAGDTVVTAGHGRLARGDAVPLRIVDLSRAGGPGGPASGPPFAPPAPPAPAASAGRSGAAPA